MVLIFHLYLLALLKLELVQSQVLPAKYSFNTLESVPVNGSTNTNCVKIAQLTECRIPTSTVLLDGRIPTLTGLDGDTWASQLLTINPATSFTEITFEFTVPQGAGFIQVERVEVVMFNCPEWGIAVKTVKLLEEVSRVRTLLESVNPTLTSCDSLVRVCLSGRSTLPKLILQFILSPDSDWMHIAEVTFYGNGGSTCPPDTIITTPPPPDTTATTTSTTTATTSTTTATTSTTTATPSTTTATPSTTTATTSTTTATPSTTTATPSTTATTTSTATTSTTTATTASTTTEMTTTPITTAQPATTTITTPTTTTTTSTTSTTELEGATPESMEPVTITPSVRTEPIQSATTNHQSSATPTLHRQSDSTTSELTQREECPSPFLSIVLAFVITAIVTALLATVIFVLVQIAICKCHPKYPPEKLEQDIQSSEKDKCMLP